MESYKNTIDFASWTNDDVLLKVTEGGGFGGNLCITDDEKFKKCLLMEGIRYPYERIKFATLVEYATSGNKYQLKVWLKLPYMLDQMLKLMDEMGYDEFKKEYFADNTHHTEKGSRWVLSLIIDLIKNSDCSLKDYLIK